MSLPKKITDVTFTLLSDGASVASHTLTVQNFTHPWDFVFWEGRKTMSLGGVNRRKKIVRGFDSTLTFNWDDVRNQTTEVVGFLSDIILTKDYDYQIRFNVVGDSNYLYVVPEDAVYLNSYINQVTQRLRPTITFKIEQLKDDIEYANS